MGAAGMARIYLPDGLGDIPVKNVAGYRVLHESGMLEVYDADHFAVATFAAGKWVAVTYEESDG